MAPTGVKSSSKHFPNGQESQHDYAYQHFGKSFFMEGSSQSSLIGFCSWMLGHADLESQAIAYQSLVLSPKPRIKLFELGKGLKVISRASGGKELGVPSKALLRLSMS